MLSAHNQLNELTDCCKQGTELSASQIEQALHNLMESGIPLEQKADFLTQLSKKGPTESEVADFAILLRELAIPLKVDRTQLSFSLIDTCGTGGDGAHTFNVSTAAALVLASTGIPVAKHGNRGISSPSGSADVLEALGIPINLSPADAAHCIRKTGFGFLFAPQYHKAFQAIQPVRKFLADQGQKTIFNLLGPLVNPARPENQIIGVNAPHLTEYYMKILAHMKCSRAFIVHGMDDAGSSCLDELSTLGPSRISRLHSNGHQETFEITPEQVGLKRAHLKDLQGGDAKANAAILESLFNGKETGPKLDFLVFNASLGLILSKKARDSRDAIRMARETLSSGAVMEKLRELRAFRAT